ncbi:hypothetical protein GOL94_26305 [Sinorhizobium medicae]|nr:hypothetical protein [Sinorhizobium medicae]MDX0659958.1 hypothetical protein [Sinorhizobium medicae]MDX1175618.1 hypothetical protein [Sinorhizobium medicae]MDX1200852.1 hypothetical protein [Sinorhizobium medicae]MDX1225136.1 hypothetical protein [Sinorhizobium medicae]
MTPSRSHPTPNLCFRRIHWHGRNGGLAEQVSRCARAIGAIAERLRFSRCGAVHRNVLHGHGCPQGTMTPRPTHAKRIAKHGCVPDPIACKRRTRESRT